MYFALGPCKRWSVRRLNVALLVANLLGAVVYVIRASPSWTIPQERGLHSMAGEPFVWAGAVLPIIMGFAILNLSWAAYISLKKHRRGWYFWSMSAAAWLVAIWIDFAHH